MTGKHIFLAAISFLCVAFAFGQNKYEKEYRLKSGEVPHKAKEFVGLPQNAGKIRWYFEENLQGNSIEAKFKLKGKRYSIEFDTLGSFQDIEIQSRFAEIPENLQKTITKHLKAKYSGYKISKLQVQYSGKIASLAEWLKTPNSRQTYTLRYELIVRAKTDKHWKMYEITLGSSGKIKSISEIIHRNTDNLEY